MRHERDAGAFAALNVEAARVVDGAGESVGEVKLLIFHQDCLSSPLREAQGRVHRQTFTADPAKVLTSAPVAVLVNRGTYGAAELTADAIEGAKRGDVVGERTFGEGSVQKTIELPDGSALLLTVAKFQGPDGKKIQDEAVAPTVIVGQNTEDEVDADENPQPNKGDEPLNKALVLLKAKNS